MACLIGYGFPCSMQPRLSPSGYVSTFHLHTVWECYNYSKGVHMVDVEEQVVELAKDGKTVNHISEITGLTRTQIANVLIEYIGTADNTEKCETTKHSSFSIMEENTSDKNSREITFKYVGHQKSLEELLAELKIDTEVWEVANVTYNEWDGMRPNDQGLIKLHQIKVSFRRIKLVTNYEIPTPINITLKSSKRFDKAHSRDNGIKTAVILPDMQVGFKRNLITGELTSLHDRRALDVALQIARYVRPDRIVLLGDNLDLPQESKYPTGPEFYFTTQAAAVELSWWLAQLRDIDPDIEIDYIAGNHDCFSEDTQILTEKGWLDYFEVDKETKIATFNKETKSIEFQNYIEAQTYSYKGEMYNIQNNACDLLITPNHRVYWADRNSKNEFEMSEISDVNLVNTRKVQYCSGINSKSDLIDISDDMIKLIAWIITDGSTSIKDKTIKLYQRTEKIHLIRDILDRLGITYTFNTRIRDIKSICGVELKNPSKEQCIITINKKNSEIIYKYIDDKYTIPEWVYDLSERQVDIFINSMVDGDGSRKKDSKSGLMLYGVKTILDQVQHLLTLNGYRTSIYTYRNSQYKLNITKNNTISLDRIVNHVNKVDYIGIIWDFTVPNDTLVVRRNGKVSITGNCRAEKVLMQNAISAYGLRSTDDLNGPPLLSVQKLLGLDKLGITYHPDYPHGKVVLNDNLVCIHGEIARSESGATVSAVVKDTRVSVIQGHIHRYEVATKTLWGANDKAYMYTAASFGCLCKIDPGAVPGVKAYQNWQQGMGIVYYEDSGLQQFRQEFIPIIDGRAILQSEIFEASDESDIIEAIEYETNFKVS